MHFQKMRKSRPVAGPFRWKGTFRSAAFAKRGQRRVRLFRLRIAVDFLRKVGALEAFHAEKDMEKEMYEVLFLGKRVKEWR